MDQVVAEIRTTIGLLGEQRERLLLHQQQYRRLASTLDSLKLAAPIATTVRLGPKALVQGTVENPQQVMVQLGAGYFVERTPLQAREILGRRQRLLDTTLAQLDGRMKQARETLASIEKLQGAVGGVEEETGDGAEEEFPIMDIVEELDENDEVVKLSVRRAGGSEELVTREARGGSAPEASVELPVSETSASTVDSTEQLSVPVQAAPMLLEPVGSLESTIDSTQSAPSPISSSVRILPEDMLQLELIAEELDNEEDFEDDGEFEFELEDDDDDDDELRYSFLPSLMGTGANNMLWQQVMARRQQQQVLSEPPRAVVREIIESKMPEANTEKDENTPKAAVAKGEKTSKSVRFASELDIKTIENVSEELKQAQREQAVDVAEAKPKRVSRFKQSRAEHGGVTGRMGRLDVLDQAGPAVSQEIVESAVSPTIVESAVAEPAVSSTVVESAAPSTQNLGNPDDLDAMARAYLSGAYDDDLDLPGPVVNELADFEAHNKAVESRATVPLPEPEAVSESDSDSEVVTDSIVEHTVDNDAALDHSLDDSTMLQLEVSMEYHRLRQRMIGRTNADLGFRKTPEELAVEPVDDEGAPVRVSRFKAARMRMNQ